MNAIIKIAHLLQLHNLLWHLHLFSICITAENHKHSNIMRKMTAEKPQDNNQWLLFGHLCQLSCLVFNFLLPKRTRVKNTIKAMLFIYLLIRCLLSFCYAFLIFLINIQLHKFLCSLVLIQKDSKPMFPLFEFSGKYDIVQRSFASRLLAIQQKNNALILNPFVGEYYRVSPLPLRNFCYGTSEASDASSDDSAHNFP